MSRKLPDWFDAYLEYRKNTEPPLVYDKWVALYAIAASMQRKCFIEWDKPTFPNIYVVLVGPSGRARKGTAIGGVEDMIRRIGVKICPSAITRERLIQLLGEPAEQVIIPGVNGEQAGILFHSSLAVIAPELTVLIGYREQMFLMNLTDWFDCKSPWSYETKHHGKDEIVGICVSLLGATTPALLQSSLPQDSVGGGFTSRVIFVYADTIKRKIIFPGKTAIEKQRLLDLQRDLEAIKALRGEFHATQGWADRYSEWYEHTARPDFKVPHLEHYIERRPIHLIKLCMIFNASRDGNFLLDAQDFDRGLRTLLEVEQDMPKVFAGVGKAKDADVLNRVMSLVAIRKRIELKEIMRVFYYDVDRDGLEKVLSTLMMMSAIRMEKVGTETVIEWTDNVRS